MTLSLTRDDTLTSRALDVLSARGCDRDGTHFTWSEPDECRPAAVCSICGGPVPEVHAHGYAAIDVEAFAQVTGKMFAQVTGKMMGEEAADALRRFAERMTQVPRAGFCSEGCAIRWQSGTPTIDEVQSAVEAPGTYLFTHSL